MLIKALWEAETVGLKIQDQPGQLSGRLTQNLKIKKGRGAQGECREHTLFYFSLPTAPRIIKIIIFLIQ